MSSQHSAALKHGWRSGLEQSTARSLTARGAVYQYEPFALVYVEPEKKRKYTPDFVITSRSGKQIIVETKGRWLRADRQKMQLVCEQHPHLDIRFVFSNPNQRIAKNSPTTYAVWCQKYLSAPWAKGDVPDAWLLE